MYPITVLVENWILQFLVDKFWLIYLFNNRTLLGNKQPADAVSDANAELDDA